MKKLILLGGGGHCKSVIDVAENAGYSISGILDIPSKIGTEVLGYKIIGSDKDIELYKNEALFIVTVGQIKSPATRIKLHQKIFEAGGKLATLISPTAYVSKYAHINSGSVIMHKAFVNAGAKIGTGCIINTFANIEHEVEIGDYCHISTGVMINGNCKIGNKVFIGSQSVVSNDISICEACICGAGSFIDKSLFLPGIYQGNPVLLKKRWDND